MNGASQMSCQYVSPFHVNYYTLLTRAKTEIPVPPENRYHSVFACPVSKEQASESNPPMMMDCGHVVNKDSLEKLKKPQRYVFFHQLQGFVVILIQYCEYPVVIPVSSAPTVLQNHMPIMPYPFSSNYTLIGYSCILYYVS